MGAAAFHERYQEGSARHFCRRGAERRLFEGFGRPWPPGGETRMSGLTQELEIVKPIKLSISGVAKWFRQGVVETHALDNVSLDVDESEFVCLVGPSGCGKSTLLNMVAGLDRPDQGSIMADGKMVTEPGRDRMMMFQ